MMKHDLLEAVNALRGQYCAQAAIPGKEFDQIMRDMMDARKPERSAGAEL
jgi:hypothetical protein